MLTCSPDRALTLETATPLWSSRLQLVECKGYGHPDTLADDLAESLSRTYAGYTLQRCGAVLHHNFDKLCLLGGRSKVTFGRAGRLTKPIRVLVNGRVSLTFAEQDLGV